MILNATDWPEVTALLVMLHGKRIVKHRLSHTALVPSMIFKRFLMIVMKIQKERPTTSTITAS